MSDKSRENTGNVGKGRPPKHTQFKPGESGNPNGRPPKLLSGIVTELQQEGFERVSASHVVEAYEVLINLNEAKIKAIIADSDAPMLLRIVGKAMLSPKGMEIVEKILDRAHGKAKQQTDLTTNGKDLPMGVTFVSTAHMTEEQIQNLLKANDRTND